MMLDEMLKTVRKCFLFFFLAAAFWGSLTTLSAAQTVTLNVLTVNGTDEVKKKDVELHLPPELTQEDIIDTDGLQLQYDAAASSYVVKGEVSLNPKESRSFKVRVNDVWQIKPQQVENIRQEMEESVKRLENTEFHANALQRKAQLEKRLNTILQEQEKYADNVDKRVDAYRSYADDFAEVGRDAVAVSYWKMPAAAEKEKRVLNFTITLENPTDSTLDVSPPYFLPKEVKPDHLAAYEGFDVKYDAEKRQMYLVRAEKLGPKETKKFQIGIVDVWSIDQKDIDDLRTRAKNTYNFLENTVYKQTALHLIESIKEKLDTIEKSQSQEKEIAAYISVYGKNLKIYESAKKDVEQLEDLLTALREELERSRLKNVLQKIKQVRSLADISEAIFGTKPTPNNAWKIILGIVIFVGIVTLVHFMIWGRRSGDPKLKNVQDSKNEEQKTKV